MNPAASTSQPTPQVSPMQIPAMNPPEAGLGQGMEMHEILEMIGNYRSFGECLKQNTPISEIAQKLARISEFAEQLVVNEAGDSFDAHTLKRNMKELKQYSGDFIKLAQEADQMNYRMNAYYEDMGRVLERYFEIGSDAPEQHVEVPLAGEDPTSMTGRPLAMIPQKGPVHESGERFKHLTHQLAGKGDRDPKALAAYIGRKKYGAKKFGQMSHHENEAEATAPTDDLTLRAIIAVVKYLKEKDKDLAMRFAKLPRDKQEKCVWKLVK